MSDSRYAILFKIPDGPDLYAGLHKGACGWAHTLATAQTFDTAEEAERFLANGYGAAARYGVIVKTTP